MSACLTMAGPHGGSSRVYLEHLARVLVARWAMDREGVAYGAAVEREVPALVSGDRGHDPLPLATAPETPSSGERAPGLTGRMAHPDRQRFSSED